MNTLSAFFAPGVITITLIMAGQVVAETKPGNDNGAEVAAAREKAVGALKDAFGENERQIAHAIKVLVCAEKMLQAMPGADRRTVVVAAAFHDIGRSRPGPGSHQDLGEEVSREVLPKLGFEKELVDHVARIVAHHHDSKGINTPEFRVIWIADRIINTRSDYSTPEKLKAAVAAQSKVLDALQEKNAAEAQGK